MSTDNNQAPPAGAEIVSPPPGAPDNAEQGNETPVDWEARYKEEADARAKAEHALRSERGRQNSREADLENWKLEQENRRRISDRKLDALASSLGSGETDSLPGAMEAIQRDSDTLDASTEWQRTYYDLSEEWRAMIQDDDGNTILGLDADEFANARELWRTAQAASDPQGLQAAINEANRALRAFLLVQRKAEKENAREAGRTEGDFDLSVGTPVAGQGETDMAWLQRVYADTSRVLTAEENLRAKKILDNL